MDFPTAAPLFIPVILGTPRQGRRSEHVANFVLSRVAALSGVETELFDVRRMALPTNDAGEQIKDATFSAATGKDGRFRMEGIIPGLKIGLLAGKNTVYFDTLVPELTLKPGEVRDVGDVKARPSE